jgi:hypothetical protein
MRYTGFEHHQGPCATRVSLHDCSCDIGQEEQLAFVRLDLKNCQTLELQTYTSLPGFVVSACESTVGLQVITIGARRLVIVTVNTSIMSVSNWLSQAGLLVAKHNISHALQGHLNPFALLDHVVDLF